MAMSAVESSTSLVETAAAPSLVTILSSVGAALYDIWVEALVIAIALHFYLRLTRATSPSLFKRRDKQQSTTKPLGRAQTWIASDPHKSHQQHQHGGLGSEQTEIRKLVKDLQLNDVDKGSLLGRYERLVRGQNVDMLKHLTDGSTARAFYSALIECGVDAAGSPSDLAYGAKASAKSTTSRLLADMRMFGFDRGHDFYVGVLRAHISASLSQDALWLHDVMVSDGVTPDRTMLTCLVNAAVSCNRDPKALTFFKEITKMGTPPMRTYMTVLRIYSKNGDWRGAVELIHGLRDSGGSPDSLVLNSVIGLCVSAGALRTAEDLLGQWPDSADVVSCNIVLKGCAQQPDFPKAEKLLARMLDRGPAPNVISFNTLMDCAVRTLQGQSHHEERSSAASVLARRPLHILDQMLEVGLEPDRYTCSTLVKGLHLTGCNAKDIDRAVALLRRVGPANLHTPGSSNSPASSRVEPGASNTRLLEVLFNSLLDACVSIRDLDRMAEIFGIMSEFKVDVSAVTFGTLIKAFGQSGRLSHCHEVWKNMMDAKVTPTTITYGCYIDACVRNSDIAAAEEVFKAMIASGERPNSVIYTSMIRGCTMSKKPLRALELYKLMRNDGIEVTHVTFNSVLDAMVRHLDDPAQLEEVLADMRSTVEPDMVTYSILIKASCNAGQLNSAIALFRQLRGRGLEFDEVAFNTLLLACSKASKVAEAEEILEEMRSVGIPPTPVTTSILVKMYGKAKMLDKAIEINRMVEEEHGTQPNLHVYTCLIQACVRNKQVRKSWDLFGRMLRSSVMPDAITYGTLIHGCIYHNKFDQAMVLVRHAYAVPQARGSDLLSLGVEDVRDAAQRKKSVPLQPDVLKALGSALRRKARGPFVEELEAITAESGKIPASSAHQASGTSFYRSG